MTGELIGGADRLAAEDVVEGVEARRRLAGGHGGEGASRGAENRVGTGWQVVFFSLAAQDSNPLPPEGILLFVLTVFRSLRHRNYRLFFIGQLISLIGTWMQSVAQSWLVYQLTGSTVLLGTVGFCGQIPVFLLGPLTGAVADRHDRRKIVIATQTCSMLLAAVLAALTFSGWVRTWHILVLASLLGW